MKIIVAPLVLLGLGTSAAIAEALPSPFELNLTVPVKIPVRTLSPLIRPAYMAMIEREASKSIQDGTDKGFVCAEIYRRVTAQPTRTYRYGEAWRLANYIYSQAKSATIAKK